MNVTWIGHAAVKISGSKTVYIDPFITGNPAAKITLADIRQADVVAVTHDHGDHIGDSAAICKKTGATLVSIYEIADAAAKQGVKIEPMSVGGRLLVNGAAVSLVPAFHTGGMGGTAVGVIIELDGKTIYHAGDTGLTMEMQLIGEMYRPDLAFLPIDGRYNMTTRLAAKAVEFLRVPRVIPIHYNTWPPIQASPEEFRQQVGGHSEVIILKPGESFEF